LYSLHSAQVDDSSSSIPPRNPVGFHDAKINFAISTRRGDKILPLATLEDSYWLETRDADSLRSSATDAATPLDYPPNQERTKIQNPATDRVIANIHSEAAELALRNRSCGRHLRMSLKALFAALDYEVSGGLCYICEIRDPFGHISSFK